MVGSIVDHVNPYPQTENDTLYKWLKGAVGTIWLYGKMEFNKRKPTLLNGWSKRTIKKPANAGFNGYCFLFGLNTKDCFHVLATFLP
jgi:hypothetical protein